MKKKKINQSKIEDSKLVEKEEKEEKRKVGRPTIFTPELRAKLIKLFEEHFFMAIVAAESDIYRQDIEKWMHEGKDFLLAITHAKDKWIQRQMILLNEYAKDKKTKDWRAQKYKLSIADIEYNDKKYLREEPGKQSSQITIIINRKDLETSKEEAYKVIGEGSHQEETISLIPFREEKKKKKEENKQETKKGEAKT